MSNDAAPSSAKPQRKRPKLNITVDRRRVASRTVEKVMTSLGAKVLIAVLTLIVGGVVGIVSPLADMVDSSAVTVAGIVLVFAGGFVLGWACHIKWARLQQNRKRR